jgi:hypothetical protein
VGFVGGIKTEGILARVLTPAILVTQEAEIRRMAV